MAALWTKKPKVFLPLNQQASDDKLSTWQLDHLANALIVDDYDADVKVISQKINGESGLIFPKDSLISGSYVMALIARNISGTNIEWDDVDIYFKSKEDAQNFLKLNQDEGLAGFDFDNDMCSYGYIDGEKYNLIYGVEYSSPAHLISRFDIRACSMAIDVNKKEIYAVDGAADDAIKRRIVFNPVPRGVSVRRLVKYIDKAFTIDRYQSVFFAELIKSKIYDPELELNTKSY